MKTDTATFANGCFWCTEAVFKRLRGVASVQSGYSGGDVSNPIYEQVSSGSSGHAESLQITYDPAIISYARLLEVFFKTHDPTTLNRQGADVGSQYRSEIFYHDTQQKQIAQRYINELEKSHVFKDPIVTRISPYKTFYPADSPHKNYYEKNRMSPYCIFVIDPKLEKLRELFPNDINDSQ